MWIFSLTLLISLQYGTGVDIIENIETKEGREADLPCKTQPDATKSSHWFRLEKDSQELRYMKGNPGVISFRTGFGDTEAFLTFHTPRFEDSGIYVYRNYQSGKSLCRIKFSVLSKPHAECNPNVHVDEGSPVTSLNCSAKGNPSPEFYWFRNNTNRTDLNISGSPLKIINVTRFASGVYVCEVRNTEGIDSCTVRLDVEFLPEVEVYESETERTEGEGATLMCKVSGNPLNTANIIWTKGESLDRLVQDYRYILETDDSMMATHYTAFSILIIRPNIFSGDMFDEYWCSVDGYGQEYRRKVVVRKRTAV